MKTFLFIDINILASIFLILTFFYMSKQVYNKSTTIKLFKNTIYLCILGAVSECLLFIVDSFSFTLKYDLKYMIILINLIIPILMINYFSKYIFTYVKKEMPLSKIKRFIFEIPYILNILLLISNIFNNSIFELNSNYEYTRKEGFAIYSGFIAIYLIHNISFILKNKKLLRTEEVTILVLNNILPIIASCIQIATDCHVLLIWCTNSIGLILIIIYMQHSLTRYDVLTKAWNRSTFEHLIGHLEDHKIENFSVAVIDLKNLKDVNNTFGYAEGNNVLEKLYKLLKRSIRTQNIITRYRQNEFIIIFFTKDLNKIKNDFKKIRENFKLEFGADKPTLDYYFYCEAFDLKTHKTYSNFIRNMEKNLIETNKLYIDQEV